MELNDTDRLADRAMDMDSVYHIHSLFLSLSLYVCYKKIKQKQILTSHVSFDLVNVHICAPEIW